MKLKSYFSQRMKLDWKYFKDSMLVYKKYFIGMLIAGIGFQFDTIGIIIGIAVMMAFEWKAIKPILQEYDVNVDKLHNELKGY